MKVIKRKHPKYKTWKKPKKTYYSAIILISFVFWIMVSSIIQMVKCPKMTSTEVFINIPDSFIFDWVECD